MVNETETVNVENKKPIFLIIIIFCLLLFWMYRGFFPFNIEGFKFLHYWVYDGFHLAFNVSNYEYNSNKYYCKISNNEQILQINEKIRNYENEIKNIDNQIIKLKSFKYNITDYHYQKV